jgi:hypothetical protein
MAGQILTTSALCMMIVAYTAAAAGEKAPRSHPNDAAAKTFIEHFFAAFDARDFAAIEHSFAPGAKIVHDNGATTTAIELKGMLQRKFRDLSWP